MSEETQSLGIQVGYCLSITEASANTVKKEWEAQGFIVRGISDVENNRYEQQAYLPPPVTKAKK
jgi:hypothetical protein